MEDSRRIFASSVPRGSLKSPIRPTRERTNARRGASCLRDCYSNQKERRATNVAHIDVLFKTIRLL